MSTRPRPSPGQSPEHPPLDLSHARRVIWLNGPFGVGKTTTAGLLRARIGPCVVTDPEHVGFLLRASIGDHPAREPDFQDYPMWRSLVAAVCAELVDHTGAPVIAPMTLLHRPYAEQIFVALDRAGIEVHHLVLHADTDTLRARIADSCEFPGDPGRSEQVRQFRRSKLAAYQHAYDDWLARHTQVIDTTTLSAVQVADAAARAGLR